MQESGKSTGRSVVYPSSSLQAAVVDAAHKRNLLAVAHATSLADTITILKAGVDGLAHTFYDEPVTAELIELYKTKKAFCIPTLTVIGTMTGEVQELATAFADDERASGLISEKEKQKMRQCLSVAAPTSNIEYAYDSVRQLKAAGIDILWYAIIP